ncbi:MAG: Oxygen-independent coproporphyrinogen-III oxidase-like protein [candidate division WS2 bacterium]|uniref:Heme chaperone HemW n=1 Tax=Psychracetigena formicireducens TaxID=2986056 RepID=A0A9E2BID2_PSYF1|nr:Oxygen-independent coproporphyrinogen-III oxidase-like protein [Candidatus Psychracetigena formicireducens]
MKQKNVHVYIHFPFCPSRCPFCCFTDFFDERDLTNQRLIPQFIEVLLKDIEAYPSDGLKLIDISFGGGTPSLLDAQSLLRIIEKTKEKFDGFANERATVSIEISPETGSLERLQSYKDIGINRVSIGAQTFSNELLRFLGRCYSAAEIFKAYENSRKAGFENVNIDLLMSFPGQTMEAWQDDLAETLALGPEHITTTNWHTKYKGSECFLERAKKKGKKIADRTFRIKLFRFSSSLLEKHGYRRYVIYEKVVSFNLTPFT